MTKIKETNPSPSQPKSSTIKCGIKIKRFMDKINNKTNTVNRPVNLSCAM